MGYLLNQGKTDDLNPRLLEVPGLPYRLQASRWKGPLPWVVCDNGSDKTAGIWKELKCLHIARLFLPTASHPAGTG